MSCLTLFDRVVALKQIIIMLSKCWQDVGWVLRECWESIERGLRDCWGMLTEFSIEYWKRVCGNFEILFREGWDSVGRGLRDSWERVERLLREGWGTVVWEREREFRVNVEGFLECWESVEGMLGECYMKNKFPSALYYAKLVLFILYFNRHPTTPNLESLKLERQTPSNTQQTLNSDTQAQASLNNTQGSLHNT